MYNIFVLYICICLSHRPNAPIHNTDERFLRNPAYEYNSVIELQPSNTESGGRQHHDEPLYSQPVDSVEQTYNVLQHTTQHARGTITLQYFSDIVLFSLIAASMIGLFCSVAMRLLKLQEMH